LPPVARRHVLGVISCPESTDWGEALFGRLKPRQAALEAQAILKLNRSCTMNRGSGERLVRESRA
jgi:hypothetical protein